MRRLAVGRGEHVLIDVRGIELWIFADAFGRRHRRSTSTVPGSRLIERRVVNTAEFQRRRGRRPVFGVGSVRRRLVQSSCPNVSTTLPTLWPPSTRRCASTICANGKTESMTGFSTPCSASDMRVR